MKQKPLEKELLDLFMKIGERSNWDKYFEDLDTLRERIVCYSSKLMDTYDSGGTAWDFQRQLIKWLDNVDKLKDKYLLINSLSYFTFFNREQRQTLEREALYGPTVKWLIDIENYDITDPQLSNKIDESIRQTCFSAATDSIDIADFRHVCDQVRTSDQTWHAYVKRAKTKEQRNMEVQSCKEYLHSYGFKQIVVMDDFIGTETQTEPILDFLGHFQEWPILFIPLVVCPQGNSAISKHLCDKDYRHIRYESVSILPWERILADKRPPGALDPPLFLVKLKEFAQTIHKKVSDSERTGGDEYLGYKGTGALYASYTNCPDNTLPLYHNKSDQWDPLFKRRSR